MILYSLPPFPPLPALTLAACARASASSPQQPCGGWCYFLSQVCELACCGSKGTWGIEGSLLLMPLLGTGSEPYKPSGCGG